MELILIILVCLLLFGGGFSFYNGYNGGIGIIGVLLVVLLFFFLFGHGFHYYNF